MQRKSTSVASEGKIPKRIDAEGAMMRAGALLSFLFLGAACGNEAERRAKQGLREFGRDCSTEEQRCPCQDTASCDMGLICSSTPCTDPKTSKAQEKSKHSGHSAMGGTSAIEEAPVDDDRKSCGSTATPISVVQGDSTLTPLPEEAISVEGVVIGDFQGLGDTLGGFFLQSLSPDNSDTTSEGLFVHGASVGIDLRVGDHVRITGTPNEYYGMTQLEASAVIYCGVAPLPRPLKLALPFAAPATLEAVEGMLITLTDLTVTGSYNLGRYGELELCSGKRLWSPNSGPISSVAANEDRCIILDDGQNAQNAEPIAYLGDNGSVRIGDQIKELTAIMHYAFGAYRLQPVDKTDISFDPANPRPLAPDNVGGDVRIALINAQNYFTTLGERGADTSEELIRQRAKLLAAIGALDADVLGLIEIENQGEAVDDLIDAINGALGTATYQRAPDPSSLGTDAIRNAILYKASRVTELGVSLTHSAEVHNRLPISQTFSYQGNRFSVVVSHFKSKGGCPGNADDPNADSGQGCWNLRRQQQAKALLEFVSSVQAQSRDDDVIVLGDLNSYLREAPVSILEAGGLHNLLRTIPEESRYSYVYSGQSGALDYALTTLSVQVTGTTIWHINADEPRFLDYNTEYNPASAYQADPFRASDHDPVLLGIRLSAAQDKEN